LNKRLGNVLETHQLGIVVNNKQKQKQKLLYKIQNEKKTRLG